MYNDPGTEKVCENFDKARERAIEYGKPYVIEVMVSKDEFVLPMIPGGKCVEDIITKVGD